MLLKTVDIDPNYVIRAWGINKDIWLYNTEMDNYLRKGNIKSNEMMFKIQSLAYLLSLCKEGTTE